MRVLSRAHFDNLQQELRGYCVIFLRIKVAGADVAVRVRGRVVAIQVEQAIIQVLAVVAAGIQQHLTVRHSNPVYVFPKGEVSPLNPLYGSFWRREPTPLRAPEAESPPSKENKP